MGAVLSCFESIFATIGNVIMTIVNAVASIFMAIIDGIVSFFAIIIGCLTCGRAGRNNRGIRGYV